jgi:hypothetical protein
VDLAMIAPHKNIAQPPLSNSFPINEIGPMKEKSFNFVDEDHIVRVSRRLVNTA